MDIAKEFLLGYHFGIEAALKAHLRMIGPKEKADFMNEYKKELEAKKELIKQILPDNSQSAINGLEKSSSSILRSIQ